jgi:hypothetical protein
MEDTGAQINGKRAILKSSDAIKADVVVGRIGVWPRMSIAERAGLATDRGVTVDAYLKTSAMVSSQPATSRVLLKSTTRSTAARLELRAPHRDLGLLAVGDLVAFGDVIGANLHGPLIDLPIAKCGLIQ